MAKNWYDDAFDYLAHNNPIGYASSIFDDDSISRIRYHATSLPIIGDLLSVYDADRYMSDYLSNRGLSWSDIRYPSRVAGSGSANGMVNKVEKSLSAIAKLYLRVHQVHKLKLFS